MKYKEFMFADKVRKYIQKTDFTEKPFLGTRTGQGFDGSKVTVDVGEYENKIKGISFYLIDIDDVGYDQPDPRGYTWFGGYGAPYNKSPAYSDESARAQARIIVNRYMGMHYGLNNMRTAVAQNWKENPNIILGYKYTRNQDYTDFIRFITKVLKIKF